MFDLSIGKIVVLGLVALFVLGPERLPGVAEEAGKSLRKLRVWFTTTTQQVQAELGPEVGELDLRSLHPREFLRKNLFEDEPPPPYTPAGGRPVLTLLPGEPAPFDPDTT